MYSRSEIENFKAFLKENDGFLYYKLWIDIEKLNTMMNANEKNNYVCFSPSNDEGIVKVYDLLFFSFKANFQAHKSEISHLSINTKGDMLVTSSFKGTILRIFSLPKGEKLFTFKRGISSAKIFSINFSQDNSHIISTSDKGTLHVFDLKKEKEE